VKFQLYVRATIGVLGVNGFKSVQRVRNFQMKEVFVIDREDVKLIIAKIVWELIGNEKNATFLFVQRQASGVIGASGIKNVLNVKNFRTNLIFNIVKDLAYLKVALHLKVKRENVKLKFVLMNFSGMLGANGQNVPFVTLKIEELLNSKDFEHARADSQENALDFHRRLKIVKFQFVIEKMHGLSGLNGRHAVELAVLVNKRENEFASLVQINVVDLIVKREFVETNLAIKVFKNVKKNFTKNKKKN
jgi:hypothetical protein